VSARGWLLFAVGASLGARAVARARQCFDYTGKLVLISGGSRGLGLVLARELAARGARLALCARDRDELARAAKELRGRCAEVHELVCDVSRRDDVQRTLRELRERAGPVDMLINNAGVIQVGPLDSQAIDDFDEALKVHFWGALHLMEGVIPEMRARRTGRIVNISSIGGRIAIPHLVPYCASKFALVGLSDGLRAELARDDVWVTTVCPGMMRTGSHVNAHFKERADRGWFSVVNSTPLISISAERAARAILAAARDGRAEAVFPYSAKLLVLARNLAPETTARIANLANRLLPRPGALEATPPRVLTALSDRAAHRNNELSRA